MKRRNDIQTFKEITAFMNGETLDNITKAQEVGKRNYQQFIYGFCVSIITFITVVFIGKLLEFFCELRIRHIRSKWYAKAPNSQIVILVLFLCLTSRLVGGS